MRYMVVMLSVFALSACYSGGDAEDFSSPQLLVSTESIFPHADDWKDADQHGLFVKLILMFDTSYCMKCHTVSGRTDLGGAPPCQSCHAAFPHAESGITKETHGTLVMQQGTSACATKCHGGDLKGGISGVSCTRCHALYPHPDGWKASIQHGLQVLGSGKDDCKLCHGTDLSGGNARVSCTLCHASYPHPPTWATAAQHGAAVNTSGTSACATACHGTDLKGYPVWVPVAEKKVKGCADCHLSMPHKPLGQWDHGRAKLKSDGTMDSEACSVCHGATLQGGITAPSCYQCHSTYPDRHRNTNWGKDGHGMQVANFGGNTPCKICHGSDLKGGVSGVSCTECHAIYPHDSNWQQTHGASTLEDAVSAGLSTHLHVEKQCLFACHSITEAKQGPACLSCHDPFDQYPHPASWYLPNDPYGGNHGPVVVAAAPLGTPLAAKAAGCLTACHGPTGENGFVDSQYLCTTCHPFYPHATDWKGPIGNSYSKHGAAVLDTKGTISKDDDFLDVNDAQKFGQCAKCHGAPIPLRDYSWFNDANLPKLLDLPNGKQVPRCYACHYFPHETYVFNWTDDNPWDYFHNSAFSNWYYLEYSSAKTFTGTKLEYAQKSCGGTYNSMTGSGTVGGCHTDGPHNTSEGSGSNGCNLCHKSP